MNEADLIQEGAELARSGDAVDDMGDIGVHPYAFAQGYANARLGRSDQVPTDYSLAMAGAFEAGYREGTEASPSP